MDEEEIELVLEESGGELELPVVVIAEQGQPGPTGPPGERGERGERGGDGDGSFDGIVLDGGNF